MARAALLLDPLCTPRTAPGQAYLDDAIESARELGHAFPSSASHRTGSLFSQCRGCGAVITVSPQGGEFEVAGRALVESCAEVRAFAAAEARARLLPDSPLGIAYGDWTIARFRDVPSAARDGDSRALKTHLKRAETLRRTVIALYALDMAACRPD